MSEAKSEATSSPRLPPMPPVNEQLTRIRRGTAEIIVESELRTKLERARSTGTPLKVKLGLDPTAPDLHLGHTVVLQKLRDFQELGHQVIIIIGDFTGLIGDPTGRSETRRPLGWDEIRANAETYRAQLGKVLDMSQARVEFNSTWLAPLSFENVIRETAHLTVARMLQREDFATRHADGRPISLHEFLYPIAQAYDSVALGSDIELGGTDQMFNLLVGRDLQRAHGQEPQVALTVPILEGLDGVQKMSKSLGNSIGVNDSAGDMFGKLMSVSDSLMFRYFDLVTRVSAEKIAALRQLHPMEAKKQLARTLTARYHGLPEAEEAEAAFIRVVQKRQTPDKVDDIILSTLEAEIPLWVVIKEAGLVASKSGGRRMIQQGAVEVDGERVFDWNRSLESGQKYLIRVGKRRFARVMLDRLV